MTNRFRTRIAGILIGLVGILPLTIFSGAQAQFNRTPTPNDTLKSVRVLPDRTVQLSIYAPKATDVVASGDFPGGFPNTKLTKAENGVWSVALGPLEPSLYTYTFVVDGVNTMDPKSPLVKRGQNNLSNFFDVPGPEAEFMALKNVPHGRVEVVRYWAGSLGTMRRMHVYTPPGYETTKDKLPRERPGRSRSAKRPAAVPAGAGEPLPVLYLLHGGGDNDASWTDADRADLILDNLYAAGKIKPMLVVMPAGHTPTPGLRMGAGPDQDPFCTELLQDIVPYVEGHFRVSAKPEHRAIAGLSMGGIQTLNIALWNPDKFAYVNAMSTGYFPPVVQELEEKHTEVLKNPTLNRLTLFVIGMGKDDPLAYKNNQNMMTLFDKMGIRYQYKETPGGHTYHVWRQNLYTLAPQLFQ